MSRLRQVLSSNIVDVRLFGPEARREATCESDIDVGANVLLAPTLFALWTLSLQDRDRARASVERLHAQDGGTFQLR